MLRMERGELLLISSMTLEVLKQSDECEPILDYTSELFCCLLGRKNTTACAIDKTHQEMLLFN